MPAHDDSPPPGSQLASSPPLVETLGISRIFGRHGEMKTAVSNVSVRIHAGEFAVIFGRSGAGKSTLLNMMLGLDPPDIGEVFVKGTTLYSYDEEARSALRRRRLGYVPQSLFWLDDMSLLDNIALPLLLNGASQSRARQQSEEMIRQIGLIDRINDLPGSLSIGEQQIAAVGRALVKRPWVCFADEPTAHLDTASSLEVMSILTRATELLGTAVVMVTHDLSLLKSADRWLFMQDGRVWNIDDRDKPFDDIRDAVAFVESFEDSSV